MAGDTTIGGLPNLSEVQDDALLVVEFQGEAYHLTGAQWKAYAKAAAYSPQRGTDYWTEEDKTEIVNEVLSNFTDVSEEGL